MESDDDGVGLPQSMTYLRLCLPRGGRELCVLWSIHDRFHCERFRAMTLEYYFTVANER